MKYKTFKLSEKQVRAIKTMMANTNPSQNGSDDLSCRRSLLKKFGTFGLFFD